MRVGILSVPCATFLNFLYGALPCRRYFARLSKSFLISSIGNHKVQQYFKNLSFRSLFVLVTNMVLRNRMLWKGSKLSNNSNHFRFLLSHKQLLISRRKRILKLFFFYGSDGRCDYSKRQGIHHMMVSKICGPFFHMMNSFLRDSSTRFSLWQIKTKGEI